MKLSPAIVDHLTRPVSITCLLFIATAAVFWPAAGGEFLLHDDDLYVTGNPHVRGGLTAENLAWGWNVGYAANWHPLTWWSLMLDAELFGSDPRGFHAVNIFLHTANAALLFLALWRLTHEKWRAAVVAALFAVHPLRVESVAWVTERKDVLAMFWGLWAILAYARYACSPNIARYGLVICCFALGLLAKSMFVTLPGLLLLLDYWPLRRMSWLANPVPVSTTAQSPPNSQRRNAIANRSSQPNLEALCPTLPIRRLIAEKLPLALLSAISAWLTMQAARSGGAVSDSLGRPGLGARLELSAVNYLRYLKSLLWFPDLAVHYPWPAPSAWWVVAAAALLLTTVSAFVVIRRQQYPWLMVGWFWYLGTLLPMVGVVSVGPQFFANRFTYLPHIGLLIMIIWSVPANWLRRAEVRHGLVTAGTVLTAGLAISTRAEISYWRDTETLFSRALAVTENNWLAHNTLGTALAAQGATDAAIEQFRHAIAIRPEYMRAHNNLGLALVNAGDAAEAASEFARALEISPDALDVELNLAMALVQEQRLDEALSHFERAAQLHPESVVAWTESAKLQARFGAWAEADLAATKALELAPRDRDIQRLSQAVKSLRARQPKPRKE